MMIYVSHLNIDLIYIQYYSIMYINFHEFYEMYLVVSGPISIYQYTL